MNEEPCLVEMAKEMNNAMASDNCDEKLDDCIGRMTTEQRLIFCTSNQNASGENQVPR